MVALSFLAYFSLSHVQELKEIIKTAAQRVIASVFMTAKETTLSSLPRGKFLATENVKQQREHNAENDAGDNRKVEPKPLSLDMDVAWKAAEPSAAEASPERGPDDRHRHADDDQKLANSFHLARFRFSPRRVLSRNRRDFLTRLRPLSMLANQIFKAVDGLAFGNIKFYGSLPD